MSNKTATITHTQPHRVGSDVPFYVIMATIGGAYVLLIIAMLVADAAYMLTGESEAVVDPVWAQEHPVLAAIAKNPNRGCTDKTRNSILNKAESSVVYDLGHCVGLGRDPDWLLAFPTSVLGTNFRRCRVGYSDRSAAFGGRT